MSALATVIEFPVGRELAERKTLEHDLVVTLATAADLASGMDAVVGRIRRAVGAPRAEWWAENDDGALALVAVDGVARGARQEMPLGSAGVFVVHGAPLGRDAQSLLLSLAPIIRRRGAEERLEKTAIELARRNEALEDYAALVAHELKTPLQAGLFSDDPARHLADALELVDTLLEAARNERIENELVSAGQSLEQAFEEVGAGLELTSDLRAPLPLPSGTLRVLLRNLLANAASAGASHVHVTSLETGSARRLLVEDDGVGLENADRYEAGSGLGLSLSRRLASRFGGVLELRPRPEGGTQALLDFAEAAR